jgi:hypothetical protein
MMLISVSFRSKSELKWIVAHRAIFDLDTIQLSDEELPGLDDISPEDLGIEEWEIPNIW